MVIKFSENLDEVKDLGCSLGAPKGSIRIGDYHHKESNNHMFYITVYDRASEPDQVQAIQKLIEAYGVSAISAALTSGLNMAAGVKGREQWNPAKPGSKKAETVL